MTVVYLDDILVLGSTPEEHDRNLRRVLKRHLDKGLRLRKEKCALIHYYHNFLSNISSLLAPLHELTCLDTEWKWRAIHQNAFEQSKALLSSSKVLAYYDPQLHIIVSSDASAYGFGRVLSHRLQDGSEKPVALA